MKIEQLSIFIENRSGRLASITRALGAAGVNIRAMSLADTSDFGILRLIVDETEEAKKALAEAGFTVGLNEVIAVEIPDCPGSLGKLLDVIEDNGLNVEYMYAFVQKGMENAVIILRFDAIEEAIRVIRESGITVLEREAVCKM